jgi:hypothetical protein
MSTTVVEPVSVKPEPVSISPMRYDRVEAILKSEPVFRDRMAVKDRTIVRRGNEKHHYASLVVETTEALHSHGIDPHNAPKLIVLRTAADIHHNAPAVRAKPVKAVKPAAPAAETAPVPATKPAKLKKVTKVQESRPETAPAVQAEAAKPQESVSGLLPADSPVVYYTNLSKLALANSLNNLMALDDDKFPGFEKRRESISFLLSEYTRLRNVGSQVIIKPDAKS